MYVIGKHTTVSSVKVEIDPLDVIKQLYGKWLASIGQLPDRYINKDGVWEDWTDTGHGSGLTSFYGQATPEEVVQNAAFATMRLIAISQRTPN